MRFLLFDRITSFEAGKVIEGTKAISMSDEALRAHFDRAALFPGSLVLEAMVQITGWLAIERSDFAQSVVLSVAEDVELPPALTPGTQLTLRGELLGSNPRGSMARATAHVEGTQVARVGRVLYAHVPHDDAEGMRRRFLDYGGGA